MKKILLLFAVLLTAITASAEDYILYTSSDGEIVKPKNNSFDVGIVSNTYEDGQGKIVFDGEVTKIESYAFFQMVRLTSIVIPNSVTEIQNNAFTETGLTSVVIPPSVTSIGWYAFGGSPNLTYVEIQNNSNVLVWNMFDKCPVSKFVCDSEPNLNLFKGSTSLTEVVIGNSVTNIKAESFKDCINLTTINIPESVVEVGDNAFKGCESLPVVNGVRYADTYAVGASEKQRKYALKEGTRFIGNEAFKAATLITSFNIPETVVGIGAYAFSGCTKLEAIEIPNSVTKIGDYAFYNCTLIKTIEIPNSVTSIGKQAFDGCLSDMTELTIPSSVTFIGEKAFSGSNFTSATFACSGEAAKNVALNSLKEITLTAEVENFEGFPFKNLSKLEKLNCWAANPPAITGAQFTDKQFDNLEVNVTPEAFSAYEYAPVWNLFLNLKGSLSTAIDGIAVDKATTGKVYNLGGQQVGEGFKGIVIENGKKVLRK